MTEPVIKDETELKRIHDGSQKVFDVFNGLDSSPEEALHILTVCLGSFISSFAMTKEVAEQLWKFTEDRVKAYIEAAETTGDANWLKSKD